MKRLFSLGSILLLSCGAAPRPDDDLAKVFENLGKLHDIATVVETYAIAHAALPRATTPDELSKAVFGHGGIVEYLVDPWGTPYAVAIDPARGSYTVTSAGSDRAFDPATTTRLDSNDSATDVVIRDGAFASSPVEWGRARFRQARPDPAAGLERAIEQGRAIRTRADAAALVLSMKQYRESAGRYPEGDTPEDVARELAKESPTAAGTDGWGTPFRITVAGDGESFRVASAGADRRFRDAASSRARGDDRYTEDLTCSPDGCNDPWLDAPDPLILAYATFLRFEEAHASLGRLTPAERNAIRREALLKELDQFREDGFYLEAIGVYQILEREQPGSPDSERLRSLASSLEFASSSPPPPPGSRRAALGSEEARHEMTGAELKKATDAICASLSRLATLHPDEWEVFDSLASLQGRAGMHAPSLATIARFEAAHPADTRVWKRRLDLYAQAGDPAGAAVAAEMLVRAAPGDVEVWHAVGVAMYESVAHAPELGSPGSPTAGTTAGERARAERRDLIARGIRYLDGALEIDPEYFPAVVYLNLMYRQAAALETEAVKKAALTAKADALRARASRMSEAKKNANRALQQ